MPDGDIYHSGIARRFQKPYKVICEGTHNPDDTLRIVLLPLKKVLQKKGDPMILHAQWVGKVVDQSIREAGFDVNSGCAAASVAVDQMRYRSGLSPRDADTVCEAVKEYIHDIRYRNLDEIGSEEEEVLERVFQRVYRSEFEEPVMNKREHYGAANPDTVKAQLEIIRPDVQETLSSWARKANAEGSMRKLRLPSRRQVAPVCLDENLL